MKKTICIMISIILLSFVCVSAASAENTNTFRNEYGSFDYKILPDGTACITGYLGFYNLVVIPAEIDGIEVSRIDDSAFYWQDYIEELIVTEGISEIGSDAFCACRNLKKVTLPDTIITVESNPFSSCYDLEEIVLSSDHPALEMMNGALITKADKCLVCCLYGILPEKYEIPEGTEIIGPNAFHFCTELTEISIPGSVQIIGYDAFSQCKKITSLTIPEGVTAIGDYAFDCCLELSSITLPESLNYIGKGAFQSGPDRVYHVRPGSYAESYCSEKGYTFDSINK